MNTELKNTLLHRATEWSKETINYKIETFASVELVKLAKTLYEIDWVKTDFKNLMLNFEKEYVHPDVKNVIVLIKKIILHSRTIEVPTTFGTRQVFETLIEDMGMQIFLWLKQVWFKLEKFDKTHFEKLLTIYLNNITWTTLGRIDYEKTVTLLIEGNKLPYEFTIFFEMSVFSFEEKLKHWYAKVKKEVVDFISHLIHERCRVVKSTETRVEHEYDYYMLAYWHYRLVNGLTHVSIDDLVGEYGRTFDHAIVDKDLGEGNMLALSAFYGHYSSVKYFWNRIVDEEKKRFYIKTLSYVFSGETGFEFYGSRTEIISFFFRMMNVDRWQAFLETLHRGEVPMMMLAVILSMPFRDFWFPTIDVLKVYIPKSTELTTLVRERVFRHIVVFYNRDIELTLQGQKMKEIIRHIFQLTEYKFQ